MTSGCPENLLITRFYPGGPAVGTGRQACRFSAPVARLSKFRNERRLTVKTSVCLRRLFVVAHLPLKTIMWLERAQYGIHQLL